MVGGSFTLHTWIEFGQGCDTLGRARTVLQADGTSVTNTYWLTGELRKVTGSRVYPVEYTYDTVGRMATMTTWRNFAGNSGAAVTTWLYGIVKKGHPLALLLDTNRLSATVHFRHRSRAQAVFADGHVSLERPALGSEDRRLPSELCGRLRNEAVVP